MFEGFRFYEYNIKRFFALGCCRYHSPNTKHDEVAVNMLEAVSKRAWSKLNDPLSAAPTPIEKHETINAATVA